MNSIALSHWTQTSKKRRMFYMRILHDTASTSGNVRSTGVFSHLRATYQRGMATGIPAYPAMRGVGRVVLPTRPDEAVVPVDTTACHESLSAA